VKYLLHEHEAIDINCPLRYAYVVKQRNVIQCTEFKNECLPKVEPLR